MTGRLAGKVAIVTGAGSGIGRASAALFAAEGARVACADLDDKAAQETARGIGEAAIACRVDVSVPAEAEKMVSDAVSAFGTVDILYANAGIGGAGNAMDLAVEDWNRMLAVNLTGVWLCCKYVLPVMVRAGHGSIINQSSVGALIGIVGAPHYGAAKAGVSGLTRQIAVEFGPKGIRCNSICPGTIPTPLVRKVWDSGQGYAGAGTWDEKVERVLHKYPLGRLGVPNDCAQLALFLASDESSWITGVSIALDGGMSAA